MKRKYIAIISVILLHALLLPLLSACSKSGDGDASPETTEKPEPDDVSDTDKYKDIEKDYIKTDGAKFVNSSGDEFIIKGWGFYNGNSSTPNMTFNEDDYKTLSDIGFNAIRFYFGSAVFETVPVNGATYRNLNQAAFDWIDRHVEWAKKYNMKIILNMHHSPGETDIGARSLFTDSDRQDRFIAIWRAIAEYFKDEPAILGFDIINEPNCGIAEGDTRPYTAAFDLYQFIVQRTINEIREVNKNQIIIVERLWISGAKNSRDNSSPNDQSDKWQNVNGKYNFPDITDDNYAYTYHIYEPRYVHQTAGGLDDGGNRVYPSSQVTKWDEKDPETKKPWEMNKRFLEYAYTIPMDYIRNEKGVPFYIGELGIHVDNFEANSLGENRGGRQWVLDLMEIFDKHKISFSYHSYFIDEFHPVFNEKLEDAFRTAFGS